MLSESFLASVSQSEGDQRHKETGGGSVYLQELRPTPTVRSTFKKCNTSVNGLAVSTSHVFAAQAEKAVVHVYSREGNHQEATVPFPERIHSLTFAGDDGGGAGILVLGTQGGRVIVWEVCTGRQVSTPASHLQPVSALAVDPAFDYIISGSEDSNLHVWSIASLLSFTGPPPMSSSPSHTLTNHQGPITSIAVGHSSSITNIAISASKDRSCIVWDYQNGKILRTILFTAVPLCLAIDPCDRAFFAGHDDGTVQLVNFFRDSPVAQHPLYDATQSTQPLQASTSLLWAGSSLNLGTTLCADLVYEGNYLLTGHRSGKVCQWDVSAGKFIKEVADYGAPVTNLYILPAVGFLNGEEPRLKALQVTKPRYDPSFSSGDRGGDGGQAFAPERYTINVQFPARLPPDDTLHAEGSMSVIQTAITQDGFPVDLLDALFADQAASIDPGSNSNDQAYYAPEKPVSSGDARAAVAAAAVATEEEVLKKKVRELESSLDTLHATHQETWKAMVEMRMENIKVKKEAKAKLEHHRRRRHHHQLQRGSSGSDAREKESVDQKRKGRRRSRSFLGEEERERDRGGRKLDNDLTEDGMTTSSDSYHTSTITEDDQEEEERTGEEDKSKVERSAGHDSSVIHLKESK